MGDIREFWIAVLIYVGGASLIHVTLSTFGLANIHPLIRVALVLGGGFVVGTGVILLWGGMVKIFRRKD